MCGSNGTAASPNRRNICVKSSTPASATCLITTWFVPKSKLARFMYATPRTNGDARESAASRGLVARDDSSDDAPPIRPIRAARRRRVTPRPSARRACRWWRIALDGARSRGDARARLGDLTHRVFHLADEGFVALRGRPRVGGEPSGGVRGAVRADRAGSSLGEGELALESGGVRGGRGGGGEAFPRGAARA